jgi:hypothetical protein
MKLRSIRGLSARTVVLSAVLALSACGEEPMPSFGSPPEAGASMGQETAATTPRPDGGAASAGPNPGPATHPLAGKWSGALTTANKLKRMVYVEFSPSGYRYFIVPGTRPYMLVELNRTGMQFNDVLSPGTTVKTTVVGLHKGPQDLMVRLQIKITSSSPYLHETVEDEQWTYVATTDGVKTSLLDELDLSGPETRMYEGVLTPTKPLVGQGR